MTLTPRESGIIGLNIVLGILVTLVVGARLWTRHVLQKSIGAEDILIGIALIATLGALPAVIIAVTVFHFGEHKSELTVAQLVRAGWLLFIAEFVYSILSGMIKIAILLFYHRLSKGKVTNVFAYILYVVMAEVILYRTAYLIVLCTSCIPLQARWEKSNPAWTSTHHYTCPTSDALNITMGSLVSAVEDLVLALLPLVLIWNLRVPLRTRIGIWLLFSMSLLTSAAGFARAFALWNAYYHNKKDLVYGLYWTWLLAMLEVALGLICSSVPALKPFVKHFHLEDHLRRLFSLAPRKRDLDNETAKESHNHLILAPQFSRAQLDRLGSIFDGNELDTTQGTMASSLAQVTWTTNPAPPSLHRRISKSFEKSIQNISEHELQDVQSAVPSPSEDGMFINVRQSVTIERKESSSAVG